MSPLGSVRQGAIGPSEREGKCRVRGHDDGLMAWHAPCITASRRSNTEASMNLLSLSDFQVLIAVALFILGCLCVLLGAFVLIGRGNSSDVKMLAASTARLAQKGLAEEVTGLVNGASALVASLNDLVRTSNGTGVFLITLGLMMIGASYWILTQVEWAAG